MTQPASKLITDIDNDPLGILKELKLLYHHVGVAYVIGITGASGTGKNILADGMIEVLRKDSMNVGVIAVDPTSLFSGGAILGDCIRMDRHSSDNGVFIRSLATRGYFGGVTKSTADVIRVIGAIGKDVAIIETFGRETRVRIEGDREMLCLEVSRGKNGKKGWIKTHTQRDDPRPNRPLHYGRKDLRS